MNWVLSITNDTNQDRQGIVTLSAARETLAPDHLGDGQQGSITMDNEMLRCAQHDMTDFGR